MSGKVRSSDACGPLAEIFLFGAKPDGNRRYGKNKCMSWSNDVVHGNWFRRFALLRVRPRQDGVGTPDPLPWAMGEWTSRACQYVRSVRANPDVECRWDCAVDHRIYQDIIQF